MSATVIEPLNELRKFEPVSDAVVLAALDRAERHRRGTGEGVMGSTPREAPWVRPRPLDRARPAAPA